MKEMVPVKEFEIVELFENLLDDTYPPYEVNGVLIHASEIIRNCRKTEYDRMFNEYCLTEGMMIAEIKDENGGEHKIYYEEVEH